MLNELRQRVVIETVFPEVDGGRFASKACVGDQIVVRACILADSTDTLAARVKVESPRKPSSLITVPMTLVNAGLDLWEGSFPVTELGICVFTIEAWVDVFATWSKGLAKKSAAGQDVSSELLEGAALLEKKDSGISASLETARVEDNARRLRQSDLSQAEKVKAALNPELALAARNVLDRGAFTSYRPLTICVERTRARFGAWYEFFPRSAGRAGQHATLKEAEQRLPDIARMGFDVVYLPPIHPVGKTHRKGPNNAIECRPQDPGSPWAIGSDAGGHKAIEPALGTLKDFSHFVQTARDLNLEIALDIAFQCSPDHPYVKEHPEWFKHRPDGSIKYAENPPKKYEDIYPFDFESAAWKALWDELRDVFFFWAKRGVRIFRVDNPHTKPYRFWEWVIGEVRAAYPDVLFLAEAFTRPAVMHQLGKLGFSQSYTYFTWRNAKAELTEYLTELTQPPTTLFMRPNFFTNTPDIVTEYLQKGGPAAHKVRAVLAATLSASYGIYGPTFELCDARAFPGTEDYVDSEKYQVRAWDLQRPENIKDLFQKLNRARQEHPALQQTNAVEFLKISSEQLLFFSKRSGEDVIWVIVNLDPSRPQEGTTDIPLAAFGLKDRFEVEDLLTGARFTWGKSNYVRLDPAGMPAHLLKVSHG